MEGGSCGIFRKNREKIKKILGNFFVSGFFDPGFFLIFLKSQGE